MKTKLYLLSSLAVVVMLLSSCATRKDLLYLQDMEETKEYPVVQKYEAIIHRDDKLSIVVSCKNPELALPFNMPGQGGYSVDPAGNITTTPAVSGGDSKNKPGYLVDVNGDIDFPILGKLHVEGLSRNQLTNMIKKMITDRELLKEPIVMVDFLNFKFTVLGEVGGVGTYEVSGDRINLLEALAMAGDLTPQSRLDRIGVIREYGNKRRITWHDIRSKDIFTSPCYYLQQNDIIYVQPTAAKAQELDQRKSYIYSTILSCITTITSLIFLFLK
ncbi:MAG: polysaccharide biosynthesis/export family protein [Bacteroidaceae bacterium]|nr:polysaccharide biosynthesis/export family protein [Bacteroidaceae bacterium]